MKTWTRAVVDTLCGGTCGALAARIIHQGEPMQVFTSPFWTKPKNRCVLCADEPVPTDLPDVPKPVAPAVKRTNPRPLAPMGRQMLPLAFKSREPGEEG